MRKCALLAGICSSLGIMNEGGVPYAISNPEGSTKGWVGKPGKYPVDFEKNVKGKVEHFDVYGEVQTKYSQVYWTRNTPIPLPKALVERFAGKVMAITGYEVDQVTHTGPKPNEQLKTKDGVLGGFACYPSCDQNGEDASVPIYHAYNHHYFGWLMGKDSELYELDKPTGMPNPTRTGVRDKPHDYKYPTNIVFKENPGGEFRKSYHGYPSGYAQLLHSPSQWVVEPMQIDTHNRKFNLTEHPGYHPSFLPKQTQNNMTDVHSGLSPLIECPCSDRISKESEHDFKILTNGLCQQPITTMQDCVSAINSFGKVTKSSTISDTSRPCGCLMSPLGGMSFTATFNTAHGNHGPSCKQGSRVVALRGETDLGGLVKLDLAHDGTTATVTMTGPDNVWFGVGFNAQSMADAPYAIIVDGDGKLSERRLVEHGPGSLLKPTIVVQSSTTSQGTRTVKLTRGVNGISKEYYNFPLTPGDVNVITAVGNTPQLAYHAHRTGAKITLVPTNVGSCVCKPTTSEFIKYMDQSKVHYGYNCFDEPRSDMKRHGDGTGRNVSNMACDISTYHGGLQCCHHTWFLTDKGQASLIPDQTDTYYLKWRYYFQPYEPATPTVPASHLHLHHWVFLIDQQVNDYEEDNANYGEKSIGKISAHLTGRDIGLEDVPANFSKITWFVMTPHCHAPSCIREEFWNADTDELICNVTGRYGSTEYGSLNDVFNEANYIAIPPCIFGNQTGLQTPFSISPDTNITAIKYFNNTYRHLGQMAQWTGLMKYDTDTF